MGKAPAVNMLRWKPRYLGLVMVVAKSFARIHWQNFGERRILPLTFEIGSDYEVISQGDLLSVQNICSSASMKGVVLISLWPKLVVDRRIPVRHSLSAAPSSGLLPVA